MGSAEIQQKKSVSLMKQSAFEAMIQSEDADAAFLLMPMVTAFNDLIW